MNNNNQGARETTSWGRVAVLYLAAIAIAFQYGKVPGALPVVRAELGLSLALSGWLASALALISAVAGAVFGTFADRIGHRNAVTLGMSLMAVASIAGGFAPGATSLLVARAFEGFGLGFAIISVAPLISVQCAPSDRQKALGIYGAYFPVGMGLMLLLAGPLIGQIGWRGLWVFNGAALLIVLGLVRLAVAGAPRAASGAPLPLLESLRDTVTRPGPWLVAASFGLYSATYMIIMAFLPLIMVELEGFSLAQATSFGAIAVVVNMIGSVWCGFLLARRVPRHVLLVIGAASVGLCALGIFAGDLPFWLRYALVLIQSAIGGLVPGCLWSGAAAHAPTPRHAAGVNGLMQQGSGWGNLLGPPAAGFLTTLTGGWYVNSLLIMAFAAVMIVLALALGRVERGLGK